MKLIKIVIYKVILLTFVMANIVYLQEEEKILPSLQYRSEVRLLQVEVYAYNKENKFYSGLTKDDFILYEDGKEQKIRYVDEIRLGISTLEESKPEVISIKYPGEKETIRSIVLIFDGCNSSKLSIQRVKDSIKDFIRKNVNKFTLMSLIILDNQGDYHIVKDFTNVGEDLIMELDKIKVGAGGTDSRAMKIKSMDTSIESVQKCLSIRGDASARQLCVVSSVRQAVNQARIFAIEEQRNSRNSMESLKKIFLFLRHVPGHKNVILFSDGFDPTGSYYFYYLQELVRLYIQQYNLTLEAEDIIRDAQELLMREATKVYKIEDLIKEANSASLTVSWLNPRNPDELLSAETSMKATIGSMSLGEKALESLTTLTEDTGGYYMKRAAFFDEFFNNLSQNINNYYLISYIPDRPSHDGRLHKIKVECKKDNVKLKLRKSIYDFSFEDQVSIMLASALDFSDLYKQLPIEKEFTYLIDDKNKINVIISIAIPFRSFSPLYEGENFIDELHYAYLVKNNKGDIVVKEHKNLQITLKLEDYNRLRVENSYYQYIYTFQLDPGVYTLYAAALEVGSWSIAGWRTPLPIVLKKGSCLTINPLIIASNVSQEKDKASSEDKSIRLEKDGSIIYKDMKLAISAARFLPSTGQLVGLYQIYNASVTSSSKAAIEITFKLYDKDGNLISALPPKEINEYTSLFNKTISNFFILPYRNLNNNKYKLVLEAKDLVNKCLASTEAYFEIKQ